MDYNLASVIKNSIKNFSQTLETGDSDIPVKIFFAAVIVIIAVVILVTVILKIKAYKKEQNILENFRVDALSELIQLNIPESEKQALCEMVIPCISLGNKIDRYTYRKENFIKVSGLVYTLAKKMKVPAKEAYLYFLASMVYDAGFLQIERSFFKSELLNEKEKKDLRTHVLRGIDYLDFVEPQYILTFISGSMLHHENFNGSGYPEGLKEKEIPDLARIIRVAESYVSMTSKRNYHKISSPEKAAAEIKSNSNLYDPEIVKCLCEIIRA